MLNKKVSGSKQMDDLPDDTCRLLATWLIPHLDKNGVFHGDPLMVKNLVFTRRSDIDTGAIDRYLLDMELVGLIVRFYARGEWWIQYPNFAANQAGLRPERETTDFPSPEDAEEEPPATILRELAATFPRLPDILPQLSTSPAADIEIVRGKNPQTPDGACGKNPQTPDGACGKNPQTPDGACGKNPQTPESSAAEGNISEVKVKISEDQVNSGAQGAPHQDDLLQPEHPNSPEPTEPINIMAESNPPKPKPRPEPKPPPLTAGQTFWLKAFNAKRFSNTIQMQAVASLEKTYGTEKLIAGIEWCAKQGMGMGKALVSLETALPKWKQPKESKQYGNGNAARSNDRPAGKRYDPSKPETAWNYPAMDLPDDGQIIYTN
jgi:hypothetical protein